MSIWSKVLIGLIMVAALGFFYMAASTLQIQRAWREEVRKYENALATIRKQNRDLKEGAEAADAAAMGIRQTEMELHKVLIDRGRVWYGCKPERAADVKTGEVKVAVNLPNPHRIKDKTVLYVFEEKAREAGGAYLGEFQAKAVADKQVTLEPVTTTTADGKLVVGMTGRELKRLAASTGTWTIYEVMPIDSHEIFTGLDDAKLKAMVPAASYPEYAKDGKPAGANDPAERVVEIQAADGSKSKVYQRQLTDYGILFDELQRQRAIKLDEIDATTKDNQRIAAAKADVDQEGQYLQAQIAKSNKELAWNKHEVTSVKEYRLALETELGKVQAAMKQTYAANKAVADELAAIQWKATQEINARTGSAQASVRK
ncbi:MAG: hypothetical protein ACYC35_23300 [Pirellulales bacterium]